MPDGQAHCHGGAGSITGDDDELHGAQAQHRMRNRRAGAAGAEKQRAAEVGAPECTLELPAPARAIWVGPVVRPEPKATCSSIEAGMRPFRQGRCVNVLNG